MAEEETSSDAGGPVLDADAEAADLPETPVKFLTDLSEALKGRVNRTSFAVTPDGSSANCSLKDAFEAARRTSRPMTFVSSRSLRIAGVRAHAVGLCDTGFFLRD